MEEVSLRELIEVLLKWKWMIAVLTIVAVLTSGVLSFFILSPVYEARATLWVNLPKLKIRDEAATSLTAIVESLAQNWQMSMESYKFIARNPVVLNQVIGRLQLDPEKYDVESLQKAITVEAPKDTNLLRVIVRSGDPKLAQQLANAVAEEFVAYVNQENRKLLSSSTEMLKAQATKEEQELNAALDRYKQFLSQPRGVAEIQQEIDAKTKLLTDFKSRLVTNQVELESNLKGLEEARVRLKQTPEKLVTSKSLADDPFLQEVVREKLQAKPEEAARVNMRSEEINPTYIYLEQKINDFNLRVSQLKAEEKTIQEAIQTTRQELENLQVELAQKQAEQDKLLSKINQLKNNYNLLSSKYEESRVAGSLDRGDTQISVAAPALEPKNPVAPRKMLNVAIAGVLGVMVSVFLAYFLEYWRTSAPGGNVAGGKTAS